MVVRKITDQVPLSLPVSSGRSDGVHVSGIIRCIAQETGILDMPEELSLVDIRSITDPVALLRISIGLAWEAYYIPLLPDVVDHPGEYEVDGVYGSPDGESVSTFIVQGRKEYRLIVHEVKATYKSTKTVGENLETVNNWMWLAQVKAYCKQTGARVVWLHVLFINGDYSYPMRPVREVWEIHFTDEEVENNWDLLIGYKRLKENN